MVAWLKKLRRWLRRGQALCSVFAVGAWYGRMVEEASPGSKKLRRGQRSFAGKKLRREEASPGRRSFAGVRPCVRCSVELALGFRSLGPPQASHNASSATNSIRRCELSYRYSRRRPAKAVSRPGTLRSLHSRIGRGGTAKWLGGAGLLLDAQSHSCVDPDAGAESGTC